MAGTGKPPGWAKTREYDYHAYTTVTGREQDLFRYDNCHGGLDTLHKHCFDTEGYEADIRSIGHPEMPTLNQIIREADFCAAHLAGLAGPSGA